MATHSSVLAWRTPGMGEPGGLPSMGLHRVRHDLAVAAVYYLTLFGTDHSLPPPGSRLHNLYSSPEGYGHPLQNSCLENPMGRGAWWATVRGLAKSQTRLQRLSIHSSPLPCKFLQGLVLTFIYGSDHT